MVWAAAAQRSPRPAVAGRSRDGSAPAPIRRHERGHPAGLGPAVVVGEAQHPAPGRPRPQVAGGGRPPARAAHQAGPRHPLDHGRHRAGVDRPVVHHHDLEIGERLPRQRPQARRQRPRPITRRNDHRHRDPLGATALRRRHDAPAAATAAMVAPAAFPSSPPPPRPRRRPRMRRPRRRSRPGVPS